MQLALLRTAGALKPQALNNANTLRFSFTVMSAALLHSPEGWVATAGWYLPN